MIRYRTHCAALLLILCASTASAQKPTTSPAPSIPAIPAVDTTALRRSVILAARLEAASLALPWLRTTSHPAFDSIDFPPGLITSIQNALLHIRLAKNIPQLDSVRLFDIEPREWDKSIGPMIIDPKKQSWVKALSAGKKKTGNKAIDRLIREYGLHVTDKDDFDGRLVVELATDSLVNNHRLRTLLFEMKGVESVDEIGMASPGPWRTVKLSLVNGSWRFTYEHSGEVGDFGGRGFIWTFDVSPDGCVTYVGQER